MGHPADFTAEIREAVVDGMPKLYIDGIKLFNERDFFECHELFEDLWRRASDDDVRFYQGLIQAAACLLHWQRSNFPAATRLANSALEKLNGLPPVMHRLELGRFIAEFRALTQPLLSDKTKLAPLEVKDCPVLVLQPM